MKAEPTKDEKFMERRGKRIDQHLAFQKENAAIAETASLIMLVSANPTIQNARTASVRIIGI